jgi:hypothetical protein
MSDELKLHRKNAMTLEKLMKVSTQHQEQGVLHNYWTLTPEYNIYAHPHYSGFTGATATNRNVEHTIFRFSLLNECALPARVARFPR